MKSYFPTLFENARLRHRIGERIMQGSAAHAYVIQGAEGCGKKMFSRLFAAALSCEEKGNDRLPLPCGTCNACRKILAHNSPDVTVVNRGENATIGVDAVRRIKEDMYLSTVENEKKVYIIEEADKMTPAAQNALLIALEEPPRDVVFLLLCVEENALLPTVRSRVQTLHMDLLREEQMASFLADHQKARQLRAESEEKFAELLVSAAGSPGRALRLLDRRELNAIMAGREKVNAVLSAVNHRMRYSVLYEALTKLGSKRPELIAALGELQLAVRDLIVLKRDENAPLCFFSNRAEACERREKYTFRTLYRIADAARESVIQLNRNANISVVLTTLANALRAAL